MGANAAGPKTPIMKIFSFGTQDNQAYLYAPLDVSGRCNPDPPRSMAAGWVPPTFELVGRDEYRSYLPKTDFPTLGLGNAVLSARAVDRLRPILAPCGEILPIHLSNDAEQFYLFNVTRIINAVDMERSKFMPLPSGSLGPCELLVFDPSKLQDAMFFRTTQLGSLYEIYASQAVADAVKKARLTGFEFTQVWES